MAWTEVGYSSSKSSSGGNSFRISLQADYSLSSDKSSATVYGRIILGAKGNYVPFYQWTMRGKLSINGVSKYDSTSLRWPWAESHWDNGSITIAGTSYAKSTNFADTRSANNYAAMGTQSQSVSLTYGSAKTVPLSGSIYSPGGTNYLPTAGWMEASGNLTIPAQTAPSPTSATVSSVSTTTTGATVTGSIGGSYTEVQYSCGGSSWQSGNSFSGLHPNTEYNFYIRGRNHNSAWVTSSAKAATTQTPALPTYTVTFDSITRTSARMVINITKNPDNYWMVHYYNTSDAWIGATAKSTGTTYKTWDGLSANTTYTFYTRVGAHNASGGDANVQSRVSRSVTTIGNAPSISSDHGCTNPGQYSATMHWSATYDNNDSLSSYKWEYGTTTSYGSQVNNTNTINNLNANTTYYYKLTVTSAKNRSSSVTGSFKTDYATQQITNMSIQGVGEEFVIARVVVPNVSWLNKVTCWVYEADGTTLRATQVKTSGIATNNDFTFENLDPGTPYIVKAQITTIGDYNSNIVSVETETIAASSFTIIQSNGSIEKYKAYVMGSGNIFSPMKMSWQNGYYTTGSIGDSISSLLNINEGACSTRGIAVIPNISYTIKNTEEGMTYIIHGTDENGIITETGYTISSGNNYTFTTSINTTRLWISATSATEPINYQTVQYYKLNIFRTVEKTFIPKENVVYVNGKIRYIDILSAGSTANSATHIVELKVFNTAGENVALNKSVEIIRGIPEANAYGNTARVTDGDIATGNYLGIGPKTPLNLETCVRVDLGQEYTDISHVTLWRYYGDGRTYYNTRILGRDGQKRLSWKFHSYKSQGTYPETAEGHTFYMTRQEIVHIPYINSIVLDPENITDTLIGTNIIIDAEPMVFMPEVIDSVESYRIDAILAANQGRLLKQDVGDLTALTTEENSSIVEAINEIWMDFNETSDYSNALNAVLNAPLMV